MPNPMVVTGGSAILGLVGASKAAKASTEAAEIQARSADAGLAQNKEFADQARADLAPYRESGEQGLGTLNELLYGDGSAPYSDDTMAFLKGGQGTSPEISKELHDAYSKSTGGAAWDSQGYNDFVSGMMPTQGGELPSKATLLDPISTELPPGLAEPIPTKFDYDPFNFEKSPGYNFRRAEGEKAIDRSAAARGSFDSGPTLKALLEYSQNYAAAEYDKSFDRYNTNRNFDYNNFTGEFNREDRNRDFGYGAFFDKYNMQASNKDRQFNYLSDITRSGQNAVGQGNTIGSNITGSNVDLITGQANARAAGTVGAANAWQSGLQNVSTAGQDYFTLKRLAAKPTGPALKYPMSPGVS